LESLPLSQLQDPSILLAAVIHSQSKRDSTTCTVEQKYTLISAGLVLAGREDLVGYSLLAVFSDVGYKMILGIEECLAKSRLKKIMKKLFQLLTFFW
jgi:hypothetical protein